MNARLASNTLLAVMLSTGVRSRAIAAAVAKPAARALVLDGEVAIFD
jgi:hypothetical protein